MARGYVPKRGDVVWLQFAPQSGHEQSGRRPALVLSPESYNRKIGMAIFCPITSQAKGYPFEMPLPSDLPISGVVLVDQIKSLDWKTRKAERCCAIGEDCADEAAAMIGALIQIPMS